MLHFVQLIIIIKTIINLKNVTLMLHPMLSHSAQAPPLLMREWEVVKQNATILRLSTIPNSHFKILHFITN